MIKLYSRRVIHLKYKDKEYLYNELIVNQKGIMQVAEEAGCTYITLRNWCKKLGIPLKSKVQMEVERLSEQIIELYLSRNMLEKDIAKELKTTVHIVRKSLEYNNIQKRSRKDANDLMRKRGDYYNRKYSLNESFFDNWSSDMAYILGLISSDGAVTKGKKSFSKWKIALKNDKANTILLNQVRNIISYEGKLHTSKTSEGFENVSLTINSKKMVDKLFEYGITNLKSLVISMPKDIPDEFIMDFIRGYFDGDGSIAITYPTNKYQVKTKTPQLRLRIVSGSEIILQQFSEAINRLSNGDIKQKKISQRKKNLYELEYSTFDSIKVYELMYRPDCISLYRKRIIFEECISIRNNICQ
jgi:LAGLIDADG-like domain